MADDQWDPDWVVHPGATLKEWIEENDLTVKVTARLCKMSIDQLQGIIDGKLKITAVTAEKLAWGTEIPAQFWLAFEHNFRVGLAAGKHWEP